MKRDIKSYQRLVTDIEVHIDGSVVDGGSLTTTGVLMGQEHVKVTENSDGNYTITLNDPGSRACFAVANAITDVSTIRIVATTASTVQVEQTSADQTTPLADGDFFLLIRKFDSADYT